MTKNEEIFLELLKIGLWGEENYINNLKDNKALFKDIDWEEVYRHAVAQTMIGILADGINSIGLNELKVPQDIKFKLIQHVIRIEQANEKMNIFLPQLYKKLNKADIHAWLLKGQGVAQCYLKPNHRQSGDIDLFFLNKAHYEKAGKLLSKYDNGKETEETEHYAFTINGIVVELHGKIVARTNRKLDRNFIPWTKEIAQNEEEIIQDGTQVILPPVAFDAIYIFIHMMRHYFEGGIGLRQVSDWMRYLYVHHHQINQEQLTAHLKRLGVTKIWKIFGAMAVNYLGCPQEYMPLYDSKFSKDGATILQYILRSGNFGYFDDRLQNRPKNFYLGKLYSFWGQIQMILRNLKMFPEESLRALPVLIQGGMERVKEKR